ncbi:hypothetical protein B0H11DRAFT_1943108 [Mycena galericulata]|nr:hypothetical protein B0H11DRAFT_1943108 [Mycena galericulata]
MSTVGGCWRSDSYKIDNEGSIRLKPFGLPANRRKEFEETTCRRLIKLAVKNREKTFVCCWRVLLGESVLGANDYQSLEVGCFDDMRNLTTDSMNRAQTTSVSAKVPRYYGQSDEVEAGEAGRATTGASGPGSVTNAESPGKEGGSAQLLKLGSEWPGLNFEGYTESIEATRFVRTAISRIPDSEPSWGFQITLIIPSFAPFLLLTIVALKLSEIILIPTRVFTWVPLDLISKFWGCVVTPLLLLPSMQPDTKPPALRRRKSVSDMACAAATGVRFRNDRRLLSGMQSVDLIQQRHLIVPSAPGPSSVRPGMKFTRHCEFFFRFGDELQDCARLPELCAEPRPRASARRISIPCRLAHVLRAHEANQDQRGACKFLDAHKLPLALKHPDTKPRVRRRRESASGVARAAAASCTKEFPPKFSGSASCLRAQSPSGSRCGISTSCAKPAQTVNFSPFPIVFAVPSVVAEDLGQCGVSVIFFAAHASQNFPACGMIYSVADRVHPIFPASQVLRGLRHDMYGRRRVQVAGEESEDKYADLGARQNAVRV